tara:strand:- start:546 stop:764 length:219 start_codon:yes stop_codon:yes gene_type:complete
MVLRITPTLIIASINYTEDSQKLNSEIKELLELSKIIFSEIVYLKKLKPTIIKLRTKIANEEMYEVELGNMF